MNTSITHRTCTQVAACLAAWLISCVSVCGAAEAKVQQFPFQGLVPAPYIYNNWPTTWQSLGSKLYDPIETGGDIADHLDFVGDATDPGAYWAQDNNYIYFRARLDVGTVVTDANDPNDPGNTYRDTIHVLIDRVGVGGTNLPDFGFSWDTQQQYVNHSLEMTKYSTGTATWGGVTMDDVDGSNSTKGIKDFNGAGTGRTTDGYLRTIDSQNTTNFGTTTFIDFAISWTYLTQYSTTGLGPGQTWRIALGSRATANDHNAISTDIAGASPSTAINLGTGWSDPITTQEVPEPSSFLVLGAVVLFGYAGSRLRRKKKASEGSADVSATGLAT